MALTFDGTNDGATTATTPVTAVPLSMACWATNLALASARQMMEISNGTDITDWFRLNMNASSQFLANTSAASLNNASTSTVTISDANYHHFAGVFASTTSRIGYIDGTASTENTASRTPTGLATVRVGLNASNQNDWFGKIAHAAVWNAALSGAEITSLAAGASPLSIQRSALVGYWPMLDSANATVDVIGGRTLTLILDAAYASGDPLVNAPLLVKLQQSY